MDRLTVQKSKWSQHFLKHCKIAETGLRNLKHLVKSLGGGILEIKYISLLTYTTQHPVISNDVCAIRFT